MVFCFVEFQDVSPDIIFHDLYLLMPHFKKKKKRIGYGYLRLEALYFLWRFSLLTLWVIFRNLLSSFASWIIEYGRDEILAGIYLL